MNLRKLIIPILALVAVACTREAPEARPSQDQIKEFTLTAFWGDPETRTERASDGAVLWSPGDQISLFYGSGENGGSCFTGQNTEPSKVVNFTGKIGVITGGNDVAVEDTYFWAVYPYSPIASCDGNSITTVLPSSQVAQADTFADDLFPSIARSQGLVMGFYNICGGIKFTVSEEGIKSVTLRGHNNEILAGTITVGFDGVGLPVINNIVDGSEIITVSAPDGETFQVGHSYYLIFVPTVFENGFTLTFSKGYSQAVYDRTKKTTIRRSAFGGLTTPDKDLEWELLSVPIPDANFKSYMIQNFDTNGNGELDFDEAEDVTEIDVCTDQIMSVAGIEYCVNVWRLECYGSGQNGYKKGQLTSLDISHNNYLTKLNCECNKLDSLDVSNNTRLEYLKCNNNYFTLLDVSHNTLLTYLDCCYNSLQSLNVHENEALIQLYCVQDNLSSLDVSNNLALEVLHCAWNQMTTLDVSNNKSLTHLNSYKTPLSSLNLSENTNLVSLHCDSNQLNSLDVSANTALTEIWCDDNQLISLDVSKNTALTELRCNSNQLTSLDVSNNTALSALSCANNQLTTLAVSVNTALTELWCGNNQLTSLDVRANSFLSWLGCSGNQLTSLDVGHNYSLSWLDCSPMNDVHGNNVLNYVYIAQGQSIYGVTVNRNSDMIPTETNIEIISYSYPLTIDNAADFVYWINSEASSCRAGDMVTLEADIDLSGRTLNPVTSFAGILDGKNHKIYNYIVESPDSTSGFFLSVSGTIKNIIFGSNDGNNWDGFSIVGYAYADAYTGHTGGVCASLEGTLDNVKNFAKVVVPMNNGLGVSGIGGLVGTMDNPSKITGCENGAVIELSGTMSYGAYAGGIVGHANNAEAIVENCVNSADLEYSLENNQYMMYGGIVGCCRLGALIDKCQNLGAVTLNQSSTDTGGSYMMIAGIAGGIYTGSMCTNCVNKGAVTSNRLQVSRIGGIVGTLFSTGLIEGNTNDGKVMLKQAVANNNWQAAGGICGFQERGPSENIIRSNINNGSVTVEVENTTTHNNKVSAGGILGLGVQGLEISENVNNGSVSIVNKAAGAAYAGGIVGWFWRGSFTANNENKSMVSCSTSDNAAAVAGGIVGYSSHDSNVCTEDKNTGAVVCANGVAAGSIAGTNMGNLVNCKAGGSVNDTALSSSNLATLTQGSSSIGTAEGTTLAN